MSVAVRAILLFGVLLTACSPSPQERLVQIDAAIAHHRAAIRDIEATRMTRLFEQWAFEHRIADDPKLISAMREAGAATAPAIRAAEEEMLRIDRDAIASLERKRAAVQFEIAPTTTERWFVGSACKIRWIEVAAMKNYQSASPDEQAKTRHAYFVDCLAPQVSTEQLSYARAAFDAETKLGRP